MAGFSRTVPLLRQISPRLTPSFFTNKAASRISKPLPFSQQTPFFVFSRSQTSHASVQTPLSSISATAISANAFQSRVHTQTSSKSVAYWLLGSAASVFGIVIFGGLTRLTESGLSITEWRPVTGSLPPFNQTDWELEFSKYRASPEYIRLNPRMNLEEFKKIYWMEWTHRLWGRVIGITFLVPTIYFIARRRVPTHMAWKLTGICGLIGFQGLIGWWMVKSGLKEDLLAPGSHPRVSQYRLAAHLGTAFVAYSAMLVCGLSILREHAMLKDPKAALSLLEKLSSPPMRRLRFAVTALTALVFTTAMSGALVAGLDAGMIYNDFPWMGLGLTPPKAELFDARYSQQSDHSDLWWRNMLENPSLVQLDHRIMATTTYSLIVGLFLLPRFSSKLRAVLPSAANKGLTGVFHMANLQVILGISTLIYMVPTALAAAHQAGALALLTTMLLLGSRLRVPRRTVQMLKSLQVQSRPSVVAQVKHSTGSIQSVVR
ncbi:COX15-CtaA-domain-containing protein [Microthyrium microscopicum]|uniref:COX15-CtaA-domain-containing protein n=1 Tax=Microthyrium microscopicum TaxID=703497 RepID=A0A6A6UC42_9PEZI|nr:COX15-CtaA-domain-containing protein [Microthyrium microscopicum]